MYFGLVIELLCLIAVEETLHPLYVLLHSPCKTFFFRLPLQ